MTGTTETQAIAPHEGYSIEPVLSSTVSAEGVAGYSCVVTATELDGAGVPLVFRRTLELSQAQAAVANLTRPGTAPPPEQLAAELIGLGVSYVKALIDVVNNGFRAIAPTATRSPSEVKSRMGMSESALRTREK